MLCEAMFGGGGRRAAQQIASCCSLSGADANLARAVGMVRKKMSIECFEVDCNIFGNFKIGDNVFYNASLLCNLVERSDDGALNKPIVLQAASILEVCFAQIFYRAANFNREGVPNISEEDQNAIAIKQIDKLEVII